MLGCSHTSRIGDNNGVSCAICGERLEGYGYHGTRGPCEHSFIPCGPGGGEGEGFEICPYCEEMRPKSEGVG